MINIFNVGMIFSAVLAIWFTFFQHNGILEIAYILLFILLAVLKESSKDKS